MATLCSHVFSVQFCCEPKSALKTLFVCCPIMTASLFASKNQRGRAGGGEVYVILREDWLRSIFHFILILYLNIMW